MPRILVFLCGSSCARGTWRNLKLHVTTLQFLVGRGIFVHIMHSKQANGLIADWDYEIENWRYLWLPGPSSGKSQNRLKTDPFLFRRSTCRNILWPIAGRFVVFWGWFEAFWRRLCWRESMGKLFCWRTILPVCATYRKCPVAYSCFRWTFDKLWTRRSVFTETELPYNQ